MHQIDKSAEPCELFPYDYKGHYYLEVLEIPVSAAIGEPTHFKNSFESNLTQQNANLQLTIQNLANENKELKDKTTTSGSTKFKLFSTGLIAGILLSLAAYISLRKPIN